MVILWQPEQTNTSLAILTKRRRKKTPITGFINVREVITNDTANIKKDYKAIL